MNQQAVQAVIDLKDRKPPQFIAIEGAIGVGKTTLARQLATTFNYDVLLEKAEENPFLERFYQNQKNAALATQLFFLFQRHPVGRDYVNVTAQLLIVHIIDLKHFFFFFYIN